MMRRARLRHSVQSKMEKSEDTSDYCPRTRLTGESIIGHELAIMVSTVPFTATVRPPAHPQESLFDSHRSRFFLGLHPTDPRLVPPLKKTTIGWVGERSPYQNALFFSMKPLSIDRSDLIARHPTRISYGRPQRQHPRHGRRSRG